MKHLKPYYRALNNPFVEMVEYIKDICLDLTDEGFGVNVTRESYWTSDNKWVKNRFSASHKHDPTSKKLLMIRVSIHKLKFGELYSRDSFNINEVKDVFGRIVAYLDDNLIVDANKDMPIMRAWYGPSITWNKFHLYEIKDFNNVVDKVEFNLHIKQV